MAVKCVCQVAEGNWFMRDQGTSQNNDLSSEASYAERPLRMVMDSALSRKLGFGIMPTKWPSNNGAKGHRKKTTTKNDAQKQQRVRICPTKNDDKNDALCVIHYL